MERLVNCDWWSASTGARGGHTRVSWEQPVSEEEVTDFGSSLSMAANQPGGPGKPPGSAGLPPSGPPNQNRVLPTQVTVASPMAGGMAGLATSPNPAGSDLASLFECPVCFDYVLPPILQCHAGHLVCSNCRPKLTCCPTCRGQLGGNIRNLAMEKVASTVMFPCKYSSGGCGVSLLHTEKVGMRIMCS